MFDPMSLALSEEGIAVAKRSGRRGFTPWVSFISMERCGDGVILRMSRLEFLYVADNALLLDGHAFLHQHLPPAVGRVPGSWVRSQIPGSTCYLTVKQSIR